MRAASLLGQLAHVGWPVNCFGVPVILKPQACSRASIGNAWIKERSRLYILARGARNREGIV